jgi:hypothetical protein
MFDRDLEEEDDSSTFFFPFFPPHQVTKHIHLYMCKKKD